MGQKKSNVLQFGMEGVESMSLELYSTGISVLQNFGFFFRPLPKLLKFAKFWWNFEPRSHVCSASAFSVPVPEHTYVFFYQHAHLLLGQSLAKSHDVLCSAVQNTYTEHILAGRWWALVIVGLERVPRSPCPRDRLATAHTTHSNGVWRRRRRIESERNDKGTWTKALTQCPLACLLPF